MYPSPSICKGTVLFNILASDSVIPFFIFCPFSFGHYFFDIFKLVCTILEILMSMIVLLLSSSDIFKSSDILGRQSYSAL